MKYKILISLFLLLSFGISAQFVTQRGSGSPNTNVIDPGARSADSGMVVTSFPDTATANLGPNIKKTNGIQIKVHDTLFVRDAATSRWIKFRFDDGNPNTDNSSRKIYGEVIWDSLLVFHSTPMSYYILGRHFNAPAKSYTLDPPYVTRNRTDIWVVDTLNNIFVIKGDSSGLKPQYNPISQFEVASVDILANTNVPSGITNTGVYLENVEWIGSTTIPGGLFNYTINPYAGIYSTYMPNFTNLQYFQYTDVTTHLLSDYSVLRFYVLSNTAYKGNINISIYNDDTVKTNLLTILNGQYGFNSSDTGVYQLVAIPISAFVPISTINFNTIRFTFSGTGTTPVQFDNVILQSGGGSTGNIGVFSFQGEDGSTPRTGNVVFRYTDDIHAVNDVTLNGDTSFYDLKNSLGNTLNSVWIAKNPITSGPSITITPYNTTAFGNPVTGYRFDATGGSISSNPQWSVRDSVNTPPVTPLDSSKFLVGTSPTGVFTGHANEIATYDSATVSYSFQAAAVGDLLYDAANSMVSQGTGTGGTVTAWVWVGRLLIHQGGDFVNYGPIKIGSIQYQPLEFITNSVRAGSSGDSTTQTTTLGFGAGRLLPLQRNSSFGVSEGNTMLGYKAGEKNTTASYNTASGMGALGSATTGGQNTATGKDALFSNVDGVNNTATGYNALRGNVSAVDNTATGWNALSGSNTGQGNSAYGKNSLANNSSGILQVAVGVDALFNNNTGSLNTAIGRASQYANTTGSNNASLGINTLFGNTTGENNTANGSSALFSNITGSNNVGIGFQAGAYQLGGVTPATVLNNSIMIGYKSRPLGSNQTNQIVIGYDVTGLGSNTALYGDSAITLSQIMGQLKTPEYGHGSHIGTPAYATGWLADGTMIEYTPGGGGGGGGNNIYNIDSVLAGDRTVGMNGKTLTFNGAGINDFIKYDSPNGLIYLTTGDATVLSALQLNAQASGDVKFSLESFNNVNDVIISGDANANTLTYTANQQMLNGKDVKISTTDGTAISSFEVEGDGGDFVGFNANATDGTNPEISIVGDAAANTITHTATSHIFNGLITYNTPPNGLLTDSIITINPDDGTLRKISSSSLTPGFDATLQKDNRILGNLRHIDLNGYSFLIGDYSGIYSTGYFWSDAGVGSYIAGNSGESLSGVKTLNNLSSRYYAFLGDDENYFVDPTHTYWNGIKYYPRDYSLYLQADSITFKTPSSLAGSVGYVPTLVDPATGYWTWQASGGGGTNYWTKTGNLLYPNNTTDSVGIGITTPVKPFQIGSGNTGLYWEPGYLNIGSSIISRASVSLNRTLTANYNSGHHGFEDHDSINTTGTPNAYASFDAHPLIYDAGSYDHFVGFQSRPEIQGSATITTRFEAFTAGLVNNTSGNIANTAGLRVLDVGGTGVGVIATNYGIRVDNIVKGSLNRAIQTGTGAVSFGDTMRVAGTTNLFKNLMVGNSSLPTLDNGITVRTKSWASNVSVGARFYNSGGSAGVGAALDLGYGDDSLRVGRIRVFSDGLNGRTMDFQIGSGTSTLSSLMTLRYNSKVGILESAPDSVFTVNGGLKLEGTIYNSVNSTDSFLVVKVGGGVGKRASAGGDALTSQPLSQFASTTSAQLAGVISDETGTAGSLVFSNTPTLVTPILGVATATSLQFNATTTNGNLLVAGSGTGLAGSTSVSQYLVGGNNVQFRVGIRGNTSTVATAGNDVFAMVIGNNTFTEATSGTSALAGGFRVNTQTFTNGSGATTDFQNVYIGDAPTGGTNNWALNTGATLIREKLSVTTGSNKSVGTATLVGGTITVNTTAVTASSLIFLTDATTGALTNIGTPTVGTITPGTSFVINSTNVLDTSVINWWIIN